MPAPPPPPPPPGPRGAQGDAQSERVELGGITIVRLADDRYHLRCYQRALGPRFLVLTRRELLQLQSCLATILRGVR